MKKSFLLLLLVCLLLSACTFGSKSSLRIAVAANLLPPMEAIQRAYEAQTGQKIAISLGSSGALNAQIRNGAPFDLYLAADEAFPRQLYAEGIGEEPPTIFAWGQLMFWSSGAVPPDSLPQLLRRIGPGRLALPAPELAPYGAAAQAWLQSQGLWEGCKDHLILGNNVSHTNQIIRSGAVDYAFTAASARYWGGLGEVGHWSPLPDAGLIPHALLILKEGEAVREFVDFLRSEVGAGILGEFGYGVGGIF